MVLNYFFIFLLTNKILESYAVVRINKKIFNKRLVFVNSNKIKANLLDKLVIPVDENLNKMRREIEEISGEARQYCGETLFYTLEFYCDQMKANGSISIYQNNESKSKTKRSIMLDDIIDDNESGKKKF